MNSKKKYIPLDPEKELKILGARIRHLRIQKGYTSMDSFAAEHGFGRNQYAEYELGKNLRFASFVRLLNAFEITFVDFFNMDVEL